MGKETRIEWTNSTWNPVTGCSAVSPGCDNCYAQTLAEKYRGTPAFPVGFDLMLRPHKIDEPVRWKEPRRIFVNSMSDLFHRGIPDTYLRRIWDTMLRADWHTYQVLTKRPHRAVHKVRQLRLNQSPHIWMGTTVESQLFADNRLPALLDIPAPVRFVSAEPLLGPLDLAAYLPGIHWVIDGGESGSHRRAADYGWFRAVRDQCRAAGVAYFHKQGNHFRSGMDRELDGRTWDEYPRTGIGAKAARRYPPQAAAPPALALAAG